MMGISLSVFSAVTRNWTSQQGQEAIRAWAPVEKPEPRASRMKIRVRIERRLAGRLRDFDLPRPRLKSGHRCSFHY
mgnify:CR=1 FL=1